MEVDAWITLEAQWIYSKRKVLQTQIVDIETEIKEKKGVLDGVVEYLNDLYSIFPQIKRPESLEVLVES